MLLCLVLAGCDRNAEQGQPVSGAPIAALPLATASPPPMRYAPPTSALPPVRAPATYRRPAEPYRYLTDAYAMADAFGDTPPDYAVDYYGEQPWVWRADDDAYRVVEWLPEGARYYYYEPGADAPFLIEDPSYAYAYDDGALVGLYTPGGVPVADSLARQRAYDAARYYARARDLHRVVLNDRRHAAYAANWRERAPIIIAERERWAQARQAQPAWRKWSRTHEARETRRWAPERQHRLAYAAALATTGAAAPLHRPQPAPVAYQPKPVPVAAKPPALFARERPEMHRVEPPPVPVRVGEARLPAPERTSGIEERPARRADISQGSGFESSHDAQPIHAPKVPRIVPARSPERAGPHQYQRPIPVERGPERPYFAPRPHPDRAETHLPSARAPAMRPAMPAFKAPVVTTPRAPSRAEIHMPAAPPAAAARSPGPPHPMSGPAHVRPDKHGGHRP